MRGVIKRSFEGEPGPCKNFLYKWRFEVTSQECITFIWGGCQGNNQNRFESEVECLAHCLGGNREFFISLMNQLGVNLQSQSN